MNWQNWNKVIKWYNLKVLRFTFKDFFCSGPKFVLHAKSIFKYIHPAKAGK